MGRKDPLDGATGAVLIRDRLRLFPAGQLMGEGTLPVTLDYERKTTNTALGQHQQTFTEWRRVKSVLYGEILATAFVLAGGYCLAAHEQVMKPARA